MSTCTFSKMILYVQFTNMRFTPLLSLKCKHKSGRPSRQSRYNHHKLQDGDRPRQDKSNDKQPKWLPKRDQDKRSEARRSGELQVPWNNHLQRRYVKGKEKSPGTATSRSHRQPLIPGGREKVTQIIMCIANKQMHDKHKDQLPFSQARWSKCLMDRRNT